MLNGNIMKARSAACVAAAISVAAFSGPIADADEFNGEISYRGYAVEPGYKIIFSGTCTDPNYTPAPLVSPVLEPAVMTIGAVHPGGLHNVGTTATVKADASPGVWPVSFKCGTKAVSTSLTVVESKAAISVVPVKGVPGTKVKIVIVCPLGWPITTAVLSIDDPSVDQPVGSATGTVKNVKPGVYTVRTTCFGKPISTRFTVLASKASPVKVQVPVKPKRAPETGGG